MRPTSDIERTRPSSVKMLLSGCLGGLICILILAKTQAQATASNRSTKPTRSSFQEQEIATARTNHVQLFMQDGLWWPKVSPENESTNGQAFKQPRRISRRSSSSGQDMPWWLPTMNAQPVLDDNNNSNNNNYHHHHHHHHNHHQHHNQGNFPKEEQNYKTATACDGSKAELNCEDGKSIHIVRAIYGRFSLNICNEYGYSNYSVNCATFRPFLYIETRCNNLTSCNVTVSKDLFDDPCPGTIKYLEVQYRCNDVNSQNNNNRQLPSSTNPVISTNPSAKQQQGPTAPPSGHKSHSSVNHNDVVGGSNSSPLPASATTTKTLEDPNGNRNDDVSPGQSGSLQTKTTSSSVDTDNLFSQQPQLQHPVIQQQYCLPQTSSRNLFWNFTRAGQVAHQPCPEGSSGRSVSWMCDYERLRFVPALSPDFSMCRSNWVTRLSVELDKMLEVPPVRQQISQGARQQDEQMIKSILGELNLLAKTKELFSEDLKRIEIMISQMIAQLRSFTVLSGGNQASSIASWSTRANSKGQSQSSLVSIYSELFAELASICSSLLDSFQRNAWLELPTAESRQYLEMRLLGHLKEAGLMFAQSLTLGQLANMQPIRQPNVVAGISVIISNQLKPLAASSASSSSSDKGANELNLFGRFFDGNNAPLLSSAEDGDAEFRLQPQLLSELEANGITKFLVLDIKKLDYSLIRMQLEQQMAAALEQQRQQQQHLAQPDIILAVDQTQFQKRIFGFFAINGESGELFDVTPATATLNTKQHDSIRKRLSELLAQWSVDIEFKMSPSASQATTGGANQQQPPRQCQSLSSDTFNMATDDGQSNSLTNRCHLSKYNATNFICSCDRFGFVALTQQFMASSQVFGPNGFPSIQNDHAQWTNTIGDLSFGRTPMIGGDHQPIDSRAYDPSYMVNRPQQQSFGLITYIFVILGVALLILTVAGLAINLTFKLTGQSRLGKKKQSFFESFRDGPTTGPLAANHNLMGSDPLVSGAATTQSASIIGLASGSANNGPMGQICASSTATGSSNYKTHHQLYSAHMGAHSPPLMDVYSPSDDRRWPIRLMGWLIERPSTWLSNLTSSNGSNANKTDLMVQHRIVGNNASTIGTLVHHKNQYQNGYTTSPGLTHNSVQQHQTIGRGQFGSSGGGSQSAMPLNPSSNSSYVSSSAYYEEIGPGNLTKVNSNHISGMGQPGGNSQHTIVDPFMMKHRHYLDGQNHHQHHQQTMPHGQGIQQQQQQQQQQQHQHQQNHQQIFHQWQNPATSNAATISFSPPIAQQQPMSLITKQHLHNDLSPLQSSSSSSAGSQHSASAVPTNLTSGMVNGSNGTTPRHFLFASPIAVTAYKQQQQQFREHHHDQLDR